MVTRSVFSTLTTFQPSVGSFGLSLDSKLSIASGFEGSHILALGRDGMTAASQTASLAPG